MPVTQTNMYFTTFTFIAINSIVWVTGTLLDEQIRLAKLAEKQQFASLFVRDVPLNDPTFGDAGQMYDPWVYLSHIAAHTSDIALGTASAITSFQHPLNLAKSAASFDRISGERLLLGLATGDRPIEFNVFGVDRENRAELFQETFYAAKKAWSTSYPTINTERVSLNGEADILPKPTLKDIPTFVTGRSGQSLEWIAKNGDGWIGYPRGIHEQAKIIRDWRAFTDEFKPFTQSLYIDLLEDPDADPTPIHLGFRSGHRFLIEFLKGLEAVGVNHVIIALKFATRPMEDVLQELGEYVLPHFPALQIQSNHTQQ
ncbi:LLM class oxidoreductase [Sporosarcina ureilytica]|nr:LLM class oxidoreductase [Sporosarcina ureilytica]